MFCAVARLFRPGYVNALVQDWLPALDGVIDRLKAGAKVADAFLSEIPILGMLSGYLFHPKYLASRSDGSPAMRLTKEPAFFEGRFRIDKLGDLTPREEMNLLLSYLMLVLLERARGERLLRPAENPASALAGAGRRHFPVGLQGLRSRRWG